MFAYILYRIKILKKILSLLFSDFESFAIRFSLARNHLTRQNLQVMSHFLDTRHRLVHYIHYLRFQFFRLFVLKRNRLSLSNQLLECLPIYFPLLIYRHSKINQYIINSLLFISRPSCHLNNVPLIEIDFPLDFIEQLN